jgi:hypothetical protein
MVLKFNNADVQNVLYNGTQLERLQLNGVTVWEHSQPIPSGTVIFEQGTAGSYDVTIPSAGEYYCTVIGGGGGSALSMHTSDSLPSVGSMVCGGGSGGYINATVRFDRPCALRVTVGAAGTSYHVSRLSAASGATWYANGSVGSLSNICSELTKVVLQANGGGRGMVSGKISGATHTGQWYSKFTYSMGSGGGWSWNNQTGITVYNITSANGNQGNWAQNGAVPSSYGTYTATAQMVLTPNAQGGYGAGGGGSATTQRIQNADDSASWNHTQGLYGPYDGYVKIVKA